MASRRGPDNSARVAIQGLQGGQNWANIFHVQFTTSSSIIQADLDAWLTAFANQFKTSFAPRQTASASYSLAKAVLYTPGGGQLSSTSAMTGTGSNVGTTLTDASAAVCGSWLTTVYWRGGKPRTYFAAPPASDVQNNNSLQATPITNWTTAMTGFRTAINALTQGTITSTQLGFVSFSSGNVARVPAVFFAVTGARVHPRLGSQRRRLGKWTN